MTDCAAQPARDHYEVWALPDEPYVAGMCDDHKVHALPRTYAQQAIDQQMDGPVTAAAVCGRLTNVLQRQTSPRLRARTPRDSRRPHPLRPTRRLRRRRQLASRIAPIPVECAEERLVTGMAGDAIDPTDVVLAEYKALKDEQTKRMGVRDGLPYVALGASIAALGAAAKFGPSVLLALPGAAVVLGWTFLANDQKISQIGRYIRSQLASYIAEHVADVAPVFGWETFHRGEPCRRTNKICQLLVDLAAFCGTGAAALAGYWTQSAARPVPVAVSVIEAAATAGLAYRIIRSADIRSAVPTPPDDKTNTDLAARR
jgi:hypothetical protein